MKDPIMVAYNPEADTRTAGYMPSKAGLRMASKSHIIDVQNAMKFLITYLKASAENHDWDKIVYLDEFYDDFKNTLLEGKSFIEGDWYKRHSKERHHSIETLEDVNLLDILEYACDCTCATLARTGSDAPIVPPSEETLKRAWENTVKLLYDNMELLDD